MAETKRESADASDKGQFGEVVDLVKSYAQQQTIDPLKRVGRQIGFRMAGALLLGMSLFFASLGLLRLIQSKIPRLARGSWSWASYAIVLVVCGLITGLAVLRISKIEKDLN